jgi:uncharacterized protein YsxB (DUF464 family)
VTKVFLQQEENRRRLSIKGHANYGPTGEDIVCAAVSMLGQTIAQYAMNLDAEGKVEALDELTCWDGAVRIDAVLTDDGCQQMDTALGVIMTGFELLQRKYPENVQILV